ncbi:MAG: M48 family metalloprotease [Thermodesulfobacteriota bacterium]
MFKKKIFINFTIPFSILFFLLSLSPAPAMTIQQERELGEKVFQEIKKRWPLIQEVSINEYVNKVGQEIIKSIGPQPFTYHFYVLNSPEINAFAIPGGRVFINSGMLLLLEKEDELAAVLAHEIGHGVARHIATRGEKVQKINLATLGAILAGILLGGPAAGAIATTSVAASETAMLKYSREDEDEADYLGLKFMEQAGYNPEGMLTVLKKLRRRQGPSASEIPAYMQTHPALEARLADLEVQMARRSLEKVSSKSLGDLKRIQTKLLVEEKELSRTATFFENWVKREPEEGEAYFGWGLVQKKIGALDRAIISLTKASTLLPQDGEVLRELGISFFLRGDLSAAEKNLEKARSLSPQDYLVHFYLGRVYAEKKITDAALQFLLQAKALRPEFADVYYHLGQAYGAKNMLGQAYQNFGYYYKIMGDHKTALLHFQKAQQYFPPLAAEAQQINKEIQELSSAPKKTP